MDWVAVVITLSALVAVYSWYSALAGPLFQQTAEARDNRTYWIRTAVGCSVVCTLAVAFRLFSGGGL
ncbi:MAG: hypothetical protein Q7W16_03950 [Coriobacteriia bacterium]|nr:hypothetical protein [Coriobacteriia bacterium]